MKTSIDIIIPAYNEGSRITPMLTSYAEFFTVSETADVTLTVVPNGCTDNTIDVVTEMQKQYPALIRIIVVPEAVGKGGAVYAGWKQSTSDIVGFVDADGATSPEEFERLIDQIVHRADIDGVIGSRFIGGATVINRTSRLRSVMSQFFVQFVRILFWLPYQDTQCGAKLFRRESITAVFPELHTTNMQFDVELLWKLKKQNRRVMEVPTVWVDQPGSAQLGSKFGFFKTGLKMVSSLIQIRLRG